MRGRACCRQTVAVAGVLRPRPEPFPHAPLSRSLSDRYSRHGAGFGLAMPSKKHAINTKAFAASQASGMRSPLPASAGVPQKRIPSLMTGYPVSD